MGRALRFVLLVGVVLGGSRLGRAQNGARDAGYQYLSPVPSAPYVSAETRFVLVRFENIEPAEVTNLTTGFISVSGANSGVHAGLVHVATDERTVIFTMAKDFSANERVTVNLNPKLAPGAEGTLKAFAYEFMITAPFPVVSSVPPLPDSMPILTETSTVQLADVDGEPAEIEVAETPVIKPNGVSVPSDFPAVVISVNNNPSPGYLFLENGRNVSPWYSVMLDNNGEPVWYRRGYIQDLKIQKNGMISWISNLNASATAAIPMSFDQNFNHVGDYTAVNGYVIDGHDFTMRKDGGYLLLGSRNNNVDLSLYVPGASKSVTVRETVIQEFTAAGELIFQWRAWDNFDIRISGTDFTHMNSIEIDEDGHILLSSRHLNEVTKIDRDTGEIIWRLSGANSSFNFVNDPYNGTRGQHNVSSLGHGRYLIFDNGNGRSPAFSRAVEYQLDLTNMTATLVWQYRDTLDKYTDRFGGAQRLPTGNTLINFGRANYPKVIEVDTNGVKQFELRFNPNGESYRSFRYEWHGMETVPYLIAEAQKDNISLIFNKFGDPDVAYYRIYGGTAPNPTNLLATSTETLKRLANLQNGQRYYFRVTAVDSQGIESDFSNQETLTVNIIKAGEQIIRNGDFSQAGAWWNWSVSGASAIWQVTNEMSFFDISSGGSMVSSLQLRQSGIPLLQGKRYLFEFDAWSRAPRYIEAKVGQSSSPFLDYNHIGLSFVTPVRAHFRYLFTMEEASDFNASVMFNLGTSAFDVYLDNVSLINPLPVAVPQSLVLEEDTPLNLMLVAGDPEGDASIFTITSPPLHGTLEGSAPQLIYRPDADYFGPDDFSFTVGDGLVDSEPATINLTVRPVNDPPVARIKILSPDKLAGTTNIVIIPPSIATAIVVLDGSASTDVENDPLTYAWLAGATVIATSETVTNDFGPGSHEITLVVSDGQSADMVTATLEVITTADVVRSLILLVENANLGSKNAKPLLSALRAATASIERGNLIAGLNQLEAFQNKVRAQIRPRDQALAGQLLEGAQSLMQILIRSE